MEQRLFFRGIAFFLIAVACMSPCVAASTDRLVLRAPSGDVLYFNVDVQPAKPPVAALDTKAFNIAPTGYFVLQKRDGKWYHGHVRAPEKMQESRTPAEGREVVTSFRPSNDGERIAWSLHVRGESGRLAITTAIKSEIVTSLTKKALGWDSTFGIPCWSPDNHAIAYLYLTTPSFSTDDEPKALLYILDLTKMEAMEKQLLPAPFLCQDASAASIRWIVGDRVVFPTMDGPALKGGLNLDCSVKLDGTDVQPYFSYGPKEADDLDDGVHRMSNYAEGPPGSDLVTAILMNLKTGITEQRSWAANKNIVTKTFLSFDGSYVAYGSFQPGANPAVLWCMIDTRSRKLTKLVVVPGDSMFMRAQWTHDSGS